MMYHKVFIFQQYILRSKLIRLTIRAQPQMPIFHIYIASLCRAKETIQPIRQTAKMATKIQNKISISSFPPWQEPS